MSEQSLQFEILKTELELVQRQIDKFDQFSMTTKTWTVTLWAASLGWVFQGRHKEILLLSIIIPLIFWFFDAINKSFRRDYKDRRDVIETMLAQLFREEPLTRNLSAPQFPQHRFWRVLTSFFVIHMALPYVFLVLLSLLLYFTFDT